MTGITTTGRLAESTAPKTLERDALDAGPPEACDRYAHAPEQAVALDMLRRSVFFAVPLAACTAMGWGWPGLASTAIALAIVLVNLMLGAGAITFGAHIGGNALMATVLGSYMLRMGIVAIAVLPILGQPWFELPPFAISLLVTHIGLLAVECRYVALTAAHPGLKPLARSPAAGPSGRISPKSALPLHREHTS